MTFVISADNSKIRKIDIMILLLNFQVTNFIYHFQKNKIELVNE